MKGENLNTFNEQCDIYQERPSLILCDETKKIAWYSSVHHLIKQKVIVQVGADTEEEDKVSIGIYSEEPPYAFKQKVLTDK